MIQWLRDWYLELTDPGLEGAWKRHPPFWRGCLAGWSRATIWGLPLLLLVVSMSCASGAANGTLTKIGHLLRAATALQELAENAADQDGTPAADQILTEQLPLALEQLDKALAELCAPGGPLPPADKVCVHYRAYKADPAE